MTIIGAEGHPGHSLFTLPSLPPVEAIGAFQEQLFADLRSGRTEGVLIHGGFIGSDFQDHGIDLLTELLALACASITDTTLVDNNFDERDLPLEQAVDDAMDETLRYVLDLLSTTTRERYRETLMSVENDRREAEAADSNVE